MKILHLLCTDSFSGAENVACQIITSCSDQNHEFVYCSLDGSIRNVLDTKGIKFQPINKMSIKELKRVIKIEKPDIIHAHDMRASFYASLVCGEIPLISHCHNNGFDSQRVSLKSILYFFAAKKAKHIFWVSNTTFSGYKFHKYFKTKSSILYNVINFDEVNKKALDDSNIYDYDVVYLGRITYQKDPIRLIHLFSLLKNIMPTIKIVVIGNGDMFKETNNLVNQLGLKNNVDFKGYMKNPYKILKDSKVMVMVSRWEGTPIAALEAMSLGLPIVSTPTDGMLELVDNDKTGFISDNDDELANSIIKICKNSDLAQELKINSIKKAYHMMDLENYKNEIMNAYSSAI